MINARAASLQTKVAEKTDHLLYLQQHAGDVRHHGNHGGLGDQRLRLQSPLGSGQVPATELKKKKKKKAETRRCNRAPAGSGHASEVSARLERLTVRDVKDGANGNFCQERTVKTRRNRPRTRRRHADQSRCVWRLKKKRQKKRHSKGPEVQRLSKWRGSANIQFQKKKNHGGET